MDLSSLNDPHIIGSGDNLWWPIDTTSECSISSNNNDNICALRKLYDLSHNIGLESLQKSYTPKPQIPDKIITHAPIDGSVDIKPLIDNYNNFMNHVIKIYNEITKFYTEIYKLTIIKTDCTQTTQSPHQPQITFQPLTFKQLYIEDTIVPYYEEELTKFHNTIKESIKTIYDAIIQLLEPIKLQKLQKFKCE
jgi:hypothetical protein